MKIVGKMNELVRLHLKPHIKHTAQSIQKTNAQYQIIHPQLSIFAIDDERRPNNATCFQ